MTVSEIVAELQARTEEHDGQPSNSTEALIRKIARIADQDGVVCQGMNLIRDERFTHEEKAICSPAVFERAERLRQEQVKNTVGKAKYKVVGPREDGKYWIVGAGIDDQGPYDTKKEANEDRIGLVRSGRLTPDEISVDHPEGSNAKREKKAAKAKATKAPKTVKPAQPEATSESTPAESEEIPSEPIPEEPGQPQAPTTEATAPESEETVKTATPKRKKKGGKQKSAKPAKNTTAAHKANGKAPKAPKAAKAKPAGEKKVGALDAAAIVLANRTKGMSATELIQVMSERKLWSSPGGKTPEATLNAAIHREINNKGKESRFKKVGPGQFLGK